MRKHRIAWLCLLGLALAPMAAAQGAGGDDAANEEGGDATVDAPENVDVNVEDDDAQDDPEESAFLGLGTTALVVIVVVAVLLVALIAIAAGRDW